MAIFLSISPNQTMFLRSVCMVPAGLFSHSCFNLCSLFKKVNNFSLVLKVAKWAVSSLTHCSNLFQVNMFISRFMIQILHNIQHVQEGKRIRKKRHHIFKLPNLPLYLPLCIQVIPTQPCS
jgi:hypothetical protein